MITIAQLLASVDLSFKPRWVTQNAFGTVAIRGGERPCPKSRFWIDESPEYLTQTFGKIKLAEFENKDWQECIYEVPRKTTGKIEKIEVGYNNSLKAQDWQDIAHTVANKINELVDAVNELKGAKND